MVVFDVGMKRAGFTFVCVLALWWAGVAHATSDFEMRGPVGAVAAGGSYKSHVLKAPKRFDLVGMRWRGRLAPTISLRARKADGRFDQTFPSAPASVELGARELVAYALRCGLSPAARARIGSAASELIDNAFRHGYGRGRGQIRVEGQLDGGDFSVRVSDEGIGFDALVLEACGLHDTLRHGLARARALSEEVQIESRVGGGTRVLLVFRASRVAFEEEGGIDLSELDFIGPDLSRRMLHALREGRDADPFQLSPALAVVVGRLLAGPDPRPSIETALWS